MRLIIIAVILLIGCLCIVSSDDYDKHPLERCGKNEEYSECGTACELTCNQPKGVACIDVCVKGCFCKKNYIRKYKDGPCICKDDCKKC